MGYNKMLPQVALGQTQSSILANAYFENDILDLVRVFIPPLTSNTMNAEALQNRGSTSGTNQEKQQGRPEKEANEIVDMIKITLTLRWIFQDGRNVGGQWKAIKTYCFQVFGVIQRKKLQRKI